MLLAGTVALCSAGVSADEMKWDLWVEAGPAWQQRNDVRIPGDTGTKYSLDDLVGSGSFPSYRVELSYDVRPRHQLRFMLAPFRYEERGSLDKDVFFVNKTFAADRKTRATYQFDSYRVTWRYLFSDVPGRRWWVGGTLKVRDAEIALRQGDRSASKKDFGVVPLVNLYGDYRLGDRWRVVVDFDGLIGPQGRALDLGLKLHYDLTKNWYVGGGYRTLEGGADNDDVYNFTWLHYAVVSVGYRF